MKTYLIRHKASGVILSQEWMKGASWWEPEANWPPVSTPRLFKSYRAALAFICQWERGRVHIKRGSNDAWDFNFGEPDELVIEPVPERHRDQLEILEATITYGNPNDQAHTNS